MPENNGQPIRVNPRPYRGRDRKRIERHQAAVEAAPLVEDYLNKKRVPGRLQSLAYADIASDLHLTEEVVCDLLLPVGGGHTGITI